MLRRELRKGGSYYAGGWSPAKKRQMDAIKLPDRLGCNACGKLQALWRFSEIQQKKLMNAIACRHVDPSRLDAEAWLRCANCTSKQVTEMECCICEQVKGLDGFTKAQRRTPDTARCIECVADHRRDLVDPEEAKKNGDDDDDNESVSVSNVHENSSFDGEDSESGEGVRLPNHGDVFGDTQGELNAENLRNLDISSGVASIKASNSVQSPSASNGRPGSRAASAALIDWQKMSSSGGRDPRQGAQYMAYDSHGNAHSRVRAASTAAGDEDSDDSDSGNTVRNGLGGSVNKAPSERDERNLQSNFARTAELGKRKAEIVPAKYTGHTVPKYKDEDDDGDTDDEHFTI